MAQRPAHTSRKKINYADMNNKGRTEEEMSANETETDLLEEGQIEDSPFRINPSEDDFTIEVASTAAEVSPVPDRRFEDLSTLADNHVQDDHDQEQVEDDYQYGSTRSRSPARARSSALNMADEDESDDKEFCQQELAIVTSREKREKQHRKLERQRRLAEEKLRDEQEKAELARMEREILDLNQKRSVVLNTSFKKFPDKTGMKNNLKHSSKVTSKLKGIIPKSLRGHRTTQNGVGNIINITGDRNRDSQLTEDEKVRRWLNSTTTETDPEPEPYADNTLDNTAPGMKCLNFPFDCRRNIRDER